MSKRGCRGKPYQNNVYDASFDVLSVLERYKDHWRLKTFYHKGLTCVDCGIVGDRIAFWYDWGREPDDGIITKRGLHVDLMSGSILMTVDHIKPRSKGGTSVLENLQPMCTNCNARKKDTYVEPAVAMYSHALAC